MNCKASSLLSLALFFILTSTSTALNITKILSDYPEYGKLNDLLTQAKIPDLVKNRQTITILALDNDSISSIENRSLDDIKKILMNHIVLDYFDTLKIKNLGKRSAILTTLYQTTGVAQDQQGFLNMTKLSPGNVVFGSAVKGSPLVAKLIGTVLAQPFNISVLQVSTPIVAPGFGDPVLAPPPPPALPPPPTAPKKAEAPAPSETEDDSEYADVPSPSPAPAPAEAPEADSPAASPPKPTDADAEAPASTAGSSSAASSVVVVAVMSLVAALVA